MVKYFLSMEIQLAIHSSPRFSTWVWLPDWRLLVDAGDGATQQMGYKIHKVDTVLLTHAHRDHIGGLLQVVNQRGEAGAFAVGYPAGSNAFDMLENFSMKFNPGSSRSAVWHALEDGDALPSGVDGRLIETFRTRHYAYDDAAMLPLSLGFDLIWRKQKLRDEYRDLSQAELDQLRQDVGREGITQEINERWITIGGDGAPLHPDKVRGTKLLLHEATFLRQEDYASDEAGENIGHIHSTMEEALWLAQESAVEQVVLYHISTRYTDVEIKTAVREIATKLGLKAKVWVALPRRVYWHILRDKPLWDGLAASD